MGAGGYPAAIIARWGSLLSDASSASLSTLHSFRVANGFSRGSEATMDDIFRFTASGETN